MEEKTYAACELSIEKMEIAQKRLFIIILILIFALLGSNIAWIVYENQYADIVTEQNVEQEADNGINRFIGGDYYGEANSNDNYEKTS